MARRLAQPSVVFGPSTIFLEFPRSDGDATKWPTNTIRVVDSDGQVNFMELLDIDESAQARKWRASVGKAIATKLEMQGNLNDYVLRDWPQNYRLYDHHKGPAGNPRHDLYLFGCAQSGRFRSINEFIPHAIWLFSDPTMNYANCECKYCTKQPQKGITASMREIIGTPSSASPAPRARRKKGERKTAPAYADVEKIPRPVPQRSGHIQDHPMLAERNSDLRAVFSRNSMKLKRWYRDGEIVWCGIKPPIQGPNGKDSNIIFWPGLVQEYKLKSVAIPRTDNDAPTPSSLNPLNSTPGPSAGPSALEEGRGAIYDKVERPAFTVEQSTIYLVELFAINKSLHVSDSQVIPYTAYIPPDDVILAMQEIDFERLDFNRETVPNFNPSPGNQPVSFEDAAGPYAVALQIASNVSQFFSPTDEWEFQYIAEAPSKPPPVSQDRYGSSLQAAIIAAGRMNSAAAVSMDQNHSNPPHLYRNLSGTRPGMAEADLNKLENDVFGSTSLGTAQTQIRFQGLWWGPERIWVDDFVRLKVPRSCLAPHGAPHISPPACPSKATIEQYRAAGGDISEIGAAGRGVFMRIDALFLTETMSEGRKWRECRASGPLYEMVDEDWDEHEDEPVKQHKMRTQGITEPLQLTEPLSIQTTSSSAPQPAPVPSTSTLVTKSSPAIIQSQPAPSIPSSSSLAQSPIHSTIQTDISANYLPPQPPVGYRFRPIITPGYQAIFSLSMIAGRYYPNLLMHPLLSDEIRRATQSPLDEGGFQKFIHVWALDGLSGTVHCVIDPHKSQPSRTRMLERADKTAYSELEDFKRQAIAERDGTVDNPEEEDVDMLANDDGVNGGEREHTPAVHSVDRDGDVAMQ